MRPFRRFPALAAALALSAPVSASAVAQEALHAEPAPETSKALADEMERSLERLRMEDVDPPYYLAYFLGQSESFSCAAQFGALVDRGRNRGRSVAIDVRVGDYDLDNTNFVNRFYLTGQRRRTRIPLDDDYASVRQKLWLATDAAYKQAVEDLAAKKAWLRTNNVADRPPDFQRVEPNVHIEDPPELRADEDALAAMCERLSAVFREYPKIQGSRVSFETGAGFDEMLNSEGSHTRKAWRFARIVAQAWTQAVDGMPLGDFAVDYSLEASGLPDEASLERRIRAMADDLSARVDAPMADEYIGPVLFEGEAAACLLLELLVDRLSRPHEPLGVPGLGTPFKNRLNRRVAPRFLTVFDDPRLADWEGVPLLGHFLVDDDGVPAQRVTLVENGRLRSWYMSRIPTRAIRETNGHSVGGFGGPGVVVVESANTVPSSEMREKALAVAREQELDHVLVVKRIARSDVRVRGVRAQGDFRNGAVRLSPPVAAWRLYADGRMTPIRGGEWQGVTLRTLRDIYATSDRAHVTQAFRNGAFVSIVCPDILVEEMEMKKPEEQHEKLPYLEHPYFARRAAGNDGSEGG